MRNQWQQLPSFTAYCDDISATFTSYLHDSIDSTENIPDSFIPRVESAILERGIKLWDAWDRPPDVFAGQKF